MSNSYRVVVTGKRTIEDIDEIRRRVLDIFDLPEKQLNALCCGKVLVIKKNIAASQAMQYKKALSSCGLEVLVEPMSEEPLVPLDEFSQADTQQQSKPASQSKQTPEIKMAPTGSRIGPRPSISRQEAPKIDHLSAGLSERLAPESAQGPPPPDVSHLEMAEVGVTLVTPTEQTPFEVDITTIDVAEVGATLGEPTDVHKISIDLDHLDIAPVGDILSESQEVQPLKLDLSHISIDEPAQDKL